MRTPVAAHLTPEVSVSVDLVVAIIAAAAGFLTATVVALLTAYLTARAVRRGRLTARADRARRYREPLLHAAYNLQSRLWNIDQQDFLGQFWRDGNERERQYAELNTIYLIGQYLCWAEIIRDEAQFLTAGRRWREKKLIAAMELIRHLLADSQTHEDPTLRLFRGDQRAVGELFTTTATADTDGPRRRCIGYAVFVDLHLTDPRIRSWMATLLQDVHSLTDGGPDSRRRMCALQNALVSLVDLIDGKGSRVGKTDRTKLPVPPFPSAGATN